MVKLGGVMNYSQSFQALVGEAHKRAPRPLGPPALVWHVGLWNDFLSHQQPNFNAYLTEVDDFIENIYNLIDLDPHQRLSIRTAAEQAESARKYPFSGGSIPIYLRYGAGVLKIIIARHYEYATITFVFDLSRPPNYKGHTSSAEPPKEEFLFRGRLGVSQADIDANVEGVRTSLRSLGALLRNGQTVEREADDEIGRVQRTLNHDFWETIKRHFQIGRPIVEETKSCCLFADFRGVVLSAGDEGSDLNWPQFVKKPLVATFDERTNAAAIERIWPLVYHSYPNARDEEFIVCNMAKRRTIYISSLGNRATYVARPNYSRPDQMRPEPLDYLLLVNGFDTDRGNIHPQRPYDRWQLGRLVTRINDICTVQLMGLRGLEQVNEAGETATRMSSELDELFAARSLFSDPVLPDHAQQHAKLRRDVNDFFDRLNKLNRGDPESLVGGLPYRIRQSKRFLDTLNRLMVDLQIEAIEGFQSYDEFLRRRLIGVFEDIEQVGVQLEGLYAKANTLVNYINWESELLKHDSEVDTLTRIRQLQALGEVAAVFGAVYYGSTLLRELRFVPGVSGWLASRGLHVPPLGNETLIDIVVALAAYVAFRGLASFVLAKVRRNGKDGQWAAPSER